MHPYSLARGETSTEAADPSAPATQRRRGSTTTTTAAGAQKDTQKNATRRPSTPLSSRTPKSVATTAKTSRQGSRTTTPLQRPSGHSARGPNPNTTGTTSTVGSTPGTGSRRRATSEPQEKVAEVQPVIPQSSPYQAPPTPTAAPFGLRKPRRGPAKAPSTRGSSAAKENDARRNTETNVHDNAAAARVNEPFSETRVATGDLRGVVSAEPCDAASSASHPKRNHRKTPASEDAPTTTPQSLVMPATTTAPATTTTTTHTSTNRAKAGTSSPPPRQPATQRPPPILTQSQSDTLVRNLLSGDNHHHAADHIPRSDDKVTAYALPLQLPPCTDDELHRLYSLLLLPLPTHNSRDSVWSLHRHLLPFLLANASSILPVSTSQLLAMLGDNDATMSEAESIFGTTQPIRARTLTRFASELCAWFFYVGTLGCGEALTWEDVLKSDADLSNDGRRVAAHATNGDMNSSVMSATPHRMTTSLKSRSPHGSSPTLRVPPPLSSDSDTHTSLPRVLKRANGSSQTNNEADGGDEEEGEEDEEEEKESTVMWRTTRWEQSIGAASSTFASVDFRCVVDVPPFVERAAFVRGYRRLQTLLSHRPTNAASNASGAATAVDAVDEFASSLKAAVRSTEAHKDGSASEHPTLSLSSHLPAGVRAGLRRVQFYIRLRAFLLHLHSQLRLVEDSPSLLQSQVMEAMVRSRLTMAAATAEAQLPARKDEGQKGTKVKARQPSWLARHVLHRGLHNAIMAANPAAVAAAVNAGVSRNAGAVNTLDGLLALRHREAERLVRDSVPVEWISAVERKGTQSPAATGTVAPVHSSLPASLRHLFPLPRWTCTPLCGGDRKGKESEPARRLSRAADGWSRHDGITVCVVAAALLSTLSFAPLLYYVVRCVEPDWMPWWDGAVRGEGDSPYAAANLPVAAMQLLVLASVLLLTHRLGSSRGSFAATFSTQRQLVRRQTAQMLKSSSAWLYAAWALQTENVVAAAASHCCLARLQLTCWVAESAAPSLPILARLPRVVVATLASFLYVFVGCAVLRFFLLYHVVRGTAWSAAWDSIWLSVCAVLVLGTTCQGVLCGWRRRRRLLWWRFHDQPRLAENFALELLQCVSTLHSGAVRFSATAESRSRQPVCFSESSSSDACLVPLPLLEELAKVAFLVQTCQRAQLDDLVRARKKTSPALSPCAVSCPADFALHCFWEQFCGRASVAYRGATAAVDVVQRVYDACAVAIDEKGRVASQRRHAVSPSPVEEMLSRLLPWATKTTTAVAKDSRHRHVDNAEDKEMAEVLAPLAMALTCSHESGARDVCSPHSPSGRAYSAAEQPIALDVNLRRAPYLNPPQQQLLVCAAFVFVAMQLDSLPHSSSARMSAASSRHGGVTTETLLCLVHLVFEQLFSGSLNSVPAKLELSPAARWREAERRSRAALRLVHRRLASSQHTHVGDGENAFSLLPQLQHILFE